MPARQHHFRFAFTILPKFIEHDTKKFVEVALADRMTDMLRGLWVRIGETEFPPEERLEPDGLRCVTDKVNGYVRVIVVMPPVFNPNECYYVAVMVKLPEFNPFGQNEPELRFFTIEKSFPMNNCPDPKAICQFDKDGNHGLLGRWTGAMHPDAFGLWVAEHLCGGAGVSARS